MLVIKSNLIWRKKPTPSTNIQLILLQKSEQKTIDVELSNTWW